MFCDRPVAMPKDYTKEMRINEYTELVHLQKVNTTALYSNSNWTFIALNLHTIRQTLKASITSSMQNSKSGTARVQHCGNNQGI